MLPLNCETDSPQQPLNTDLQNAAFALAQRKVRRRKQLLSFLAIADIIIGAVLLLYPFGFNFNAYWRSQWKGWSTSTSLTDWFFVDLTRDISVAILLCLKGRTAISWARRIVTVVFLLGILRLTFLTWDWPDAHRILNPLVMFECVVSFFIIFIANILLGAHDSLEALTTEDIEKNNTSDSQYSSALTYWQTLKIMKPYFWPSTGGAKEVRMNRIRAISTWIFVSGSKVSNLLSPIFLASATNAFAELLLNSSTKMNMAIVGNLIAYAFFIFMGKFLKEGQSLVYIKVQQAASIEIADTTFAHLHSLSLEWHLKKKMGNVIRSMDRGIAAAQQSMQYVFLYLLPTLAEAFALTLIFFFHFNNPRLAVFVFLGLVLYIYGTVQITLWRKQFLTSTTKHDNELHDKLTDSLVNYETVKYFTAEKYEREAYTNTFRNYQKSSMATAAALSFLNIFQQGVINVTLAIGLMLSVSRLLTTDGSVGEFVATNVYILNVFQPLSFLGTIYNMMVNAAVDMKNFGQLLAEKSTVTDISSARSLDVRAGMECPMIEFQNVSFCYHKQPKQKSLRDVSFMTARGGTTALVGSTGAGKTTIVRLLFRFYDPISGQCFINGQDIRTVTQNSLRSAIGMVPQDVVLFNASIKHNVLYGRIDTATMTDVETAIDKAQLREFVEMQSDKYETVVGERGLKLSGGEKQRMAIARCLVKDPPIVVLDEATSALDSQTELKVQEALAVLSNARTVLTIAHRLSTIKDYDEILVLDSGKIIERGSHSELLASEESTYFSLWHKQSASQEASNTEDAGLGFANQG